MAYVAPTTRADGYVVPASEWNKNTVDNPIALRAGEVAIASQATGDVITAASATQLGRVAPSTAGTVLLSNGVGVAPSFGAAPGAAGTVLTSNGAGVAPSFAVPVGTLTLLKANTGSTTNAAAEDVDTFAITGLTVKDTLKIEVSIQAVTQNTASVLLRNSTDGVTITDVWDSGAGAFTAGTNQTNDITVRNYQSATTLVGAVSVYRSAAAGAIIGGASTFTTDWTGAWTIALRQGGVTAGGTFRWSWAIYKVAGQ